MPPSRCFTIARLANGAEFFAVTLEESAKALNGVCQIKLIRQEDDTQVVRGVPVETGTLHQQYFFLIQGVQ